MFDVIPSIECSTFAAEHGFDLCAEMGSWVPTWSNSARGA
jgi:hypothetical protein